MLLLAIFTLGEIFSLISVLFITYFGTPEKLFTNYNRYDGMFMLFLTAMFGGWITFPFFIYAVYKQIEINNQ